MRVKTSELTGLALRYAVILSQFPNAFEGKPSIRDICEFYPYDEDWHLAGPIIEREKIAIGYYAQNTARGLGVYASRAKLLDEKGSCFMYGPTPLIAAMRCFVASKLGDEVDVPAEL